MSDPALAARFRPIRRCLNEAHSKAYPPKTQAAFARARAKNPDADWPYAEEDSADELPAEAIGPYPQTNSWCSFLTVTPDKKQYVESSTQAADEDSHSASLFRLLRFESARAGTIFESCREFLEKRGERDHFRACFDAAGAQPALVPDVGR